MSHDGSRYDVVVIGGGFAGAVAGRDLTEQGYRVLLLEARDRLGGRTFSTKFPGTDVDIEMGGQYIVPGRFPATEREIERYAFELSEVPEPEAVETILAGNRLPGMFPPMEQMFDMERAALHCIKAASRIDTKMPLDYQGLADLDIPLSEFLAPLELPPETYDFAANVLSFFSFRYAEEESALPGLLYLAYNDLSVIETVFGVSVKTRTGALATRIAQDTTEVRLDCPVVRVDQTGDDVLVTTAGAETVAASAVVVATPMNTWNDIEFLPPLNEEKRAASAEQHASNRTAKASLRVRNVPTTTAVLAAPRWVDGGFQLYTEKLFDNGDQLMNLFAWTSVEGDDYHLDLGERESVERVLEKMLPGAELVDWHHHNWVTDPFSKGANMGWLPGRLSKSHSVLAAAEGRLAFAGADIAPTMLVTIEGAVLSGHQAARQALTHLEIEREAISASG